MPGIQYILTSHGAGAGAGAGTAYLALFGLVVLANLFVVAFFVRQGIILRKQLENVLVLRPNGTSPQTQGRTSRWLTISGALLLLKNLVLILSMTSLVQYRLAPRAHFPLVFLFGLTHIFSSYAQLKAFAPMTTMLVALGSGCCTSRSLRVQDRPGRGRRSSIMGSERIRRPRSEAERFARELPSWEW